MMKDNYYCARIYLIHKCNSCCWFCDTHDDVYKQMPVMAFDTAKNLIRQLYGIGIKYIDLTGGEPTLNNEIGDIIAYAQSLGIRCEVTTNGVADSFDYETGELSSALYGVLYADKLNISLDTLDKEKYKKIRGVDGLDKTMQSICELSIRRKKRIKIMTVVSQDNLDEIDDLVDFAKKNQVMIYFNPVFLYGTKGRNEAWRIVEQIRKRIFCPNTEIQLALLELYMDIDFGNDHPRCSACRETLTFASDGSILAPCYHACAENRIFISEYDSISEALKSQDYINAAQLSGHMPQCKMCQVSPYYGISFAYRLDKYFLLSSFSEDLKHLKQLYLGTKYEIHEKKMDLIFLDEMIELVRSIKVNNSGDGLYDVYLEHGKYITDIYRETLSPVQYQKDMEAEDCWALEHTPHAKFQKIYGDFYEPYAQMIHEGKHNLTRNQISIVQNAYEFMMRFWIVYVWLYMKSCCTDESLKKMSEHIEWVIHYLELLKNEKEVPDFINMAGEIEIPY